MKIYFTAAITNAKDEDRSRYQRIVKELEKQGHVVIHEHILSKKVDELKGQSPKESISVQKKMSKWKKQADLVVVEGTTPSFGVGQEIMEALTDNKQVIVLHSGDKPHILTNQGQDAIYFAEYKESNLGKVMADFIEYAKSRSDTRFNFFISPQIGAYLDWIARTRKVPRAVYLRRLIEKDMDENEEYSG